MCLLSILLMLSGQIPAFCCQPRIPGIIVDRQIFSFQNGISGQPVEGISLFSESGNQRADSIQCSLAAIEIMHENDGLIMF